LNSTNKCPQSIVSSSERLSSTFSFEISIRFLFAWLFSKLFNCFCYIYINKSS